MKSIRLLLAGAAIAVLAAGCSSSPTERTPPVTASVPATPPARAAAEVDLGHHSFKITTDSPAAQRAFDRGLTLAYAFSHEAAVKEFQRALEADPNCAMAWWGIALVNGPHINFPLVPPDRAQTAWNALTNAQARAANTSELERALIGALARRYANPQPEDRSPLDQAYAEAMREVWQKFPRNADVGTLYAEASMDLHPWDFWNKDGRPQPWTGEIVVVIERSLQIDPRHPGANHLQIHVLEASPQPEAAQAAADRLRDLVPGASHLVHMPSHIDARVGHWSAAATANRKAMDADAVYRAAHPRPGFYAMYMAHNAHFLAFTAMMRGRSAEAISNARQMVAAVPEEFLANYGPIADGYMIFVSEALMRFGRWEELLAEPPRKDLPLATALWHFTRGAALTALDRPAEAQKERTKFVAAAAAVPKDAAFGNNPASNLLAIASHVLDGEMAARAGRFDEAIAQLRAAGRIEDQLRYDEPPDWIQPTRHTLGAVLLRAGRPAEAEAVYREDLAQYRENGWSLFGLSRALRRQGKDEEAKAVEQRFAQAWQDADVKLVSTCFCQPGD